jgi:hypothetical protein
VTRWTDRLASLHDPLGGSIRPSAGPLPVLTLCCVVAIQLLAVAFMAGLWQSGGSRRLVVAAAVATIASLVGVIAYAFSHRWRERTDTAVGVSG